MIQRLFTDKQKEDIWSKEYLADGVFEEKNFGRKDIWTKGYLTESLFGRKTFCRKFTRENNNK